MRICILSRMMTKHREHYLPVPARLARDFTAMGHQIITLTTVSPVGEYGVFVENESEVFYLKGTRSGIANNNFWKLSAAKFDELHSELPFDFVLGRGNSVYGFLLLSRFSGQVPVICHEGTYPDWPHRLKRRTGAIAQYFMQPVIVLSSFLRPKYRKCIVKADRTVCNSPALAETLAKISWFSPPRTTFIPYGFDLEPYKATSLKILQEVPPRIIFVGRLTWDKGVLAIIEILAKLQRRDVLLEVVGPGSHKVRKAMLKHAIQLGVKDRVLLSGPVHNENLPEKLTSAFVFLLPSTHAEGLNKTIMEAMSASLPVITYELPGMDVLVKQGKTGWRVPTRDTFAAAAKIDALLADPKSATIMGRAGHEMMAENFSHAKIASMWNTIFEDIKRDWNLKI